LTCIVNAKERDKTEFDEVKLPSYLNIIKDITDLEEYMPIALAAIDYKSK
jgi:hypothetical protein